MTPTKIALGFLAVGVLLTIILCSIFCNDKGCSTSVNGGSSTPVINSVRIYGPFLPSTEELPDNTRQGTNKYCTSKASSDCVGESVAYVNYENDNIIQNFSKYGIYGDVPIGVSFNDVYYNMGGTLSLAKDTNMEVPNYVQGESFSCMCNSSEVGTPLN